MSDHLPTCSDPFDIRGFRARRLLANVGFSDFFFSAELVAGTSNGLLCSLIVDGVILKGPNLLVLLYTG